VSFPPTDFDLALFRVINEEARCEALDVLMPAVSLSELAVAALVIALIVFLARRRFRPAAFVLWMALAVTAVDAGTHAVKEHFGRVRPVNSLAGAYYHQDGDWRRRPADFQQTKEHGSSYFSAHAANSMCLAVMAMLFWPGLNPWILLAPLAVGYSRIYLAKHFPTDVLAGWAFGAMGGWALALVFEWLDRRLAALRPVAAVQRHPHPGRNQKEHNAEHDLDR
jgi:undecaprenyl-diphosphatase